MFFVTRVSGFNVFELQVSDQRCGALLQTERGRLVACNACCKVWGACIAFAHEQEQQLNPPPPQVCINLYMRAAWQLAASDDNRAKLNKVIAIWETKAFFPPSLIATWKQQDAPLPPPASPTAPLPTPSPAAAAAAPAAAAPAQAPPSSSFASAPPSIEAISSATIDINDSKNRSILTRGATQAALGKEFGVTICTRGR
jgi:hypothetical protein